MAFIDGAGTGVLRGLRFTGRGAVGEIAVVPLSPEHNGVSETGHLFFRVDITSSADADVEIEVSSDDTFTTTDWSTTLVTLSSGDYNVLPTGLTPGTTYYWRMRAGEAGSGVFGDWVVYGEIIPPPSPVDISTVSGKVLWLRAKDVIGSNGDPVATWEDASPEGHDGTSSALGSGATTEPYLVTGITPNGGPAVRYGNHGRAAKATHKAHVFPDLGLTSSGEVWIVLATPYTGTDNDLSPGLWHFGTGDNSAFPYTDGKVYENFGVSTRYSYSYGSDLVTNEFVIYRVQIDSGTAKAWLNGTLKYSAASTAGWATAPVLGRSAFGGGNTTFNSQFGGHVAEVLVFDHALSPTDEAIIEDYLQYEHFLSSSPSVTYWSFVYGPGRSEAHEYTYINLGAFGVIQPDAHEYVTLNVGSEYISNPDGHEYVYLNVGFEIWLNQDGHSYIYLGDIDESTPHPHIWWLYPAGGREGDGIKIVGYGFGHTQVEYDGVVEINWGGTLGWQPIAHVSWQTTVAGSDAYTEDRRISEFLNLSDPEHQIVEIIVPPDAIPPSYPIRIRTDGP